MMYQCNKDLKKSCFSTVNSIAHRFIDRLDTGLKLNIHKMFRRRPIHLLNLLYTFNLQPVFKG